MRIFTWFLSGLLLFSFVVCQPSLFPYGEAWVQVYTHRGINYEFILHVASE